MPERIFFYGDSNTWGYQPGGGRLADPERFTGIVAGSLHDVEVIEDGLNGRNATWVPGAFPELAGGMTFWDCFSRVLPCDVLVIMLGTNDVFPPVDHTASEIVEDLEAIVREARELMPDIRILLVAPVPLSPACIRVSVAEDLGRQELLSQDLAGPMAELARRQKTAFFNAGDCVACADAADGVHLAGEAHQALGRAISEILGRMLGMRD